MRTKFFTNADGNTLFKKFEGLLQSNNFYEFLAAIGYFRVSGYFKLRECLEKVPKIRILIGINADKIFKNHTECARKQLYLFDEIEDDEARSAFIERMVQDINKDANYSKDVENSIRLLIEDIQSGKVELRVYKKNNLHAKFYIFLPEVFNDNTDGRVIMGSSNLSASGLGISDNPRYELNVEMKEFVDVNFCKDEFEKLWEDAMPLSEKDIDDGKNQTYIKEITPYELYIKALITHLGVLAEDDYATEMPDGFKKLQYQADAALQGYQMMMKHNGFILADVVGLGKTIVAAMIARRFVDLERGKARILVVTPPAIQSGWRKTFKKFGLHSHSQYVTNGSIDKIIDEKDNYAKKEEFDLVIVDEAHNYRNDDSGRFDQLQTVCKSVCIDKLSGTERRKKVMLISATPLNNNPEDLKNLLALFQDMRSSTIDGILDLDAYFDEPIRKYKEITSTRNESSPEDMTQKVHELYEKIRNDVLKQITIRRTRHNIENHEPYKADLQKNGVLFPTVEPPKDLKYRLSPSVAALYKETLDLLENGVQYARYRATEFLKENADNESVRQRANNLMGIYKTHMFKRLESSFHAFKQSLKSFIASTQLMLDMYNADKVVIMGSRDNTLHALLNQDLELDEIFRILEERGKSSNENTYARSAFKDDFKKLLEADLEILHALDDKWACVDEDPKLDLFVDMIQTELFKPALNQTQKLVVFTESVDTVHYLSEKLAERIHDKRILAVTAANRESVYDDIAANFDANLDASEKKDDIQILISSDVLSEGINLHRAHIIVNYDTPWNATRLMQRIGRVNRIGSECDTIHNYMFYPSDEGDEIIELTSSSLIKLQGFHSALGEDAQVFSRDEILHEFELFNKNVRDENDDILDALREVRTLYQKNRKEYERIKALPAQIRVARKPISDNHVAQSTIAYISSPFKSQFYFVNEENDATQDADARCIKCKPIRDIDALKILKAKSTEHAQNFEMVADKHYAHVDKSKETYRDDIEKAMKPRGNDATGKMNDSAAKAEQLLREFKRTGDPEINACVETLKELLRAGSYNQLPKQIQNLKKEADKKKTFDQKVEFLRVALRKICEAKTTKVDLLESSVNTTPSIILSETFI